MLTLDLPVEPYLLDLPRGVRVEIRPVTTAVMAAAKAGSARRLGALRSAEADLDPDMARGLAFAFLGSDLIVSLVAWICVCLRYPTHSHIYPLPNKETTC
ncbi:MAG: hypothetical protein DDT25_01303 [Chloroflexi bacterium]|nr:hypothetical protein [Chloroflexota bacterium]